LVAVAHWFYKLIDLERYIMENAKKYGLWVVMGLTTFAFVSAGVLKLMGTPEMHDSFSTMGLPSWMGYFIGAAEVAGGVAIWFRKLSAWAGLGLAIIMVGGAYFHIAYSVPSAVPAIVLGVFAGIVVYARKSDALFLSKS
jgi:uncharacterized membrane protein YphA (DoxX/SURF4 family)